MESFAFFPSLPATNLLAIFQKLNPVSFTRLRKTCRFMDELAEKQRSQIGVKLYQINLIPQQLSIRKAPDEELTADDYELLIHIRQMSRGSGRVIKLSEAVHRLSGFTFDLVDTHLYQMEKTEFSNLPRLVRETIMKLVRGQKWRCTAMSMSIWPTEEILHTIRPKILRLVNREVSSSPSVVETVVIEIYSYEEKGLVSLRSIPPNVKNILIESCAMYADNLCCLPEVFSQITDLFYKDTLPGAHVQVRALLFTDHVLQPIIDRRGNEKAGILLLEAMLRGTYYSRNKIEYSSVLQAKKYGERWIATGNTILTSRTGRRGLLAVRLEDVYRDDSINLWSPFSKTAREFGGWDWKLSDYDVTLRIIRKKQIQRQLNRVAVSVYFWKDRLQPINATDEYYQIPSDGIDGHELATHIFHQPSKIKSKPQTNHQ